MTLVHSHHKGRAAALSDRLHFWEQQLLLHFELNTAYSLLMLEKNLFMFKSDQIQTEILRLQHTFLTVGAEASGNPMVYLQSISRQRYLRRQR